MASTPSKTSDKFFLMHKMNLVCFQILVSGKHHLIYILKAL